MKETVYSSAPALSRPRHFLREALRDLRSSRAAATALFLANLRAQHRRAWLGYVWLLIPAAGVAAICAFILSRRIVSVGPTELSYPLFVLTGMVLWQAFVDGLNAPMEQLGRARQLIARSAMPHEVVFGAGLLQAGLNAAIRLAVLAVVLVAAGPPLAVSALLFPLGLAALILLGFAVGLLVAPFGLLYDDVGRALLLATTLLFFVTPVVYPLPADGLFRLNPVASLIGTARSWLIGDGTSPTFLIVAGGTVGLLVLAWLLYRIARPHVIARLG